jgi:VanZ family protein
MLRTSFFRSRQVAVGWFILMCILFFLPGSAFPESTFFSKIHFDKWVHVGLFASLLFLWRSAFDLKIRNYGLLLLLSAFAYGLTVEFIQKEWVPLRDFDLFDVVADMTGALIGLLVWREVYKKNKPL